MNTLAYRHPDGGPDRAVPGGGRAGRRRHRHADRLCHGAGDEPVRLLEFRQGAAVHVWRAPGRCRQRAASFIAWWRSWRRRRSCPCPRFSSPKIRSPTPLPPGAIPNMPRSASPPACWRQVNQEELAGVLAHELGHVKHRDTLTMTITAVMAGAISMLANMAFFMGGSRDREHPLGMVGMLLVTLLAPIAAMLVQAAISRSPRIRSRPRRRRNHRPAAVAGLRAGPDRARGAAHRRIIPPTPIPPRRICSSSIRCMAASAGCSPPILRPKNASRGCSAMAGADAQRRFAKVPGADQPCALNTRHPPGWRCR